jgi:regulatory protein
VYQRLAQSHNEKLPFGATGVPVITDIEPQKHDEERVSIYLDGKFGFGVSRMAAAARGLVPGRSLTEDDIEALRNDDEIDRALNATLNFLSYRPRSRREIEDYLRRKGIDQAAAPAVVARLERMGLVDDREFARFWVENRQTFRPRGVRALRFEMRQKGLDNDVIDTALEHIDDEEPIAYSVGQKKQQSYRSLEGREFLTRMTQFLQRRGFPYGVSSSVARRLLQQREEGDESGLEEDLPEWDGEPQEDH